jgi:hypothetical protein
LAIDDKNGINACKLIGVAFTNRDGHLGVNVRKALLSSVDYADSDFGNAGNVTSRQLCASLDSAQRERLERNTLHCDYLH